MVVAILTPEEIVLAKKLGEAMSLRATAEYGLKQAKKDQGEVTRAINKIPFDRRQKVWAEAREQAGF